MPKFPVGAKVQIIRTKKAGKYTVAGWEPLTSRYILRDDKTGLPVFACACLVTAR